MNMQTRLIRFDEQTVPGTSPDDLNPALWRRFRTVLSPRDDLGFLEKMKPAAPDGDGTLRARVGGLSMTARYRGDARNAATQPAASFSPSFLKNFTEKQP